MSDRFATGLEGAPGLVWLIGGYAWFVFIPQLVARMREAWRDLLAVAL